MPATPQSPAALAATATAPPPPVAEAPAPAPAASGQITTQPRPQQADANDTQFDVAIIGSGPGGYVAAIRAAQLGLKTAIIERQYMGGTCLNVGCIPTKAMLTSVAALATAKRGKDFGFTVSGDIKPDYGVMVQKRDKVVEQMRGGVAFYMKKNGVAMLNGTGQIRGPRRVQVTGAEGQRDISANNILIATGSVPAKPPIPGAELEGVVNSDQLLRLEKIPARLAIVGAGAVGLEWGDIFNELGSKITVFEMVDQVLPPADGEVAAELAKELKKKGFEIHTSAMVKGIVQKDGGLAVQFSTPTKGDQESAADVVLIATGRWPYTDGLGLENVGITLERRAIPVNNQMQTRATNIYAIGDVVPGLQLAHVASKEGEVAVETMAGHKAKMDYSVVPSCVYTHPEVSWVGLTEAEAREEHKDVRIGKFPFRALGRAVASQDREGFMKVIAEPKYGQILGVHMIGSHVTDLIAEPVLAMTLEATVEEIWHAIHAHPTYPEALMEASLDVWERSIHKP